MLFHHDGRDYNWDFMAILFTLNYTYGRSVTRQFWFCNYTHPYLFQLLDILVEYWIEHVAFRLLDVMFRLSTRIFYRGVPGFATGRPFGVWYHGITTCLLYVGPLLKI